MKVVAFNTRTFEIRYLTDDIDESKLFLVTQYAMNNLRKSADELIIIMPGWNTKSSFTPEEIFEIRKLIKKEK